MTGTSPPAGNGEALLQATWQRLRRSIGVGSWSKTLALRRILAIVLVVLAGVLALRPSQAAGSTAHVVVAARDIAPGTKLTADDLRVVDLPAATVPHGALTETSAAIGQLLAGAARGGEPLTDARLVGATNTRLSTGDPNAVAVPVRLADPGVAGLLQPGDHVDIVTVGDQTESMSTDSSPPPSTGTVLADDVTVITVADAPASDGQNDQGKLVVIAVPQRNATLVAANSLHRAVTVTLR